MKFLLVGFLGLVTIGAAGAAVFFSGILDGDSTPTPPPEPKAAAEAPEGRDGGVVDVAQLSPERGVVRLTVRPPSSASVRINSSTSDFKEEWNSSGVLELRGLDEGTYRTKVTPTGGSAQRGAFDVLPGQVCDYTFNTKVGEWKEKGCEALQ